MSTADKVTDTIGFGIIGTGMGGNRARMTLATEGAALRAVCDLRAETAQARGAEWDCDWTTSPAELMARDDVDVVGVFTPSGTHGNLAIAAAEAGKHVITTKPPEVTVARVNAMAAAASKAGALLAVDYQSRYMDAMRRVKQALDAGRLGRPLLAQLRVKAYRTSTYFTGGSPPGWRGTWRYDGGGSLANQSIHELDLLQWFMGPVVSVQARTNIFKQPIETEDTCHAWLNFGSGAWGTIETTTISYGQGERTIEAQGTNGSIRLTDWRVREWHFQDETDDGSQVWEPDLPADRPRNIIEDVVKALREGTPLTCPIEEGRKSVAILEAIYASARAGGCTVRVWQ